MNEDQIEKTLKHLNSTTEPHEQTATYYHVWIPSVFPRGCKEIVSITQSEVERDMFHFSEIALGPVNTRRLADFLASLPNEPEEDE